MFCRDYSVFFWILAAFLSAEDCGLVYSRAVVPNCKAWLLWMYGLTLLDLYYWNICLIHCDACVFILAIPWECTHSIKNACVPGQETPQPVHLLDQVQGTFLFPLSLLLTSNSTWHVHPRLKGKKYLGVSGNTRKALCFWLKVKQSYEDELERKTYRRNK